MFPTVFDTGFPVSVMTFNLKNGMNIISWLRRRTLLARVIDEANPLFIGTQEGYSFQLRFLRKQLSGYQVVGESRRSRPEDEHCAILIDTSRTAVRDSGTHWLSTTPDEPGSKFEREHFPRIMTWAVCDVDVFDRPVMVVNTHLTNDARGIDAQIGVLLAEIERHAPDGIDIILMGDFNAGVGSTPWETVRDAGFVDALDFVTTHTGPILTAHEWRGVDNADSPPNTLQKRIDWILYRPGDGTTLPQDCVLETIDTHDGDNYPSDHFPVLLRNQLS